MCSCTHVLNKQIRDSSVSIATGKGSDGRDSNPDRGKIFLFSVTSRPAPGSAQLIIKRAPRALSPEVKRPEVKADHSPQSSAEVKNGGVILSLPYISSWHSAYLIKHRDNFTKITF
jgi:hypothetical protein